jgi:membrane associated rhomboid family serine protease
MWFLWVFGNNIEDAMGHGRFVAFYLVCGVLAGLAHIITDPSSPLPVVGASGAISGIMGAYLVLYPKVRVHTLVVLGFFITTLTLPAYFMLLYWAVLQLAGTAFQSSGGVAFMAHVGGFVAGVVLIKLFTKPDLLAAARRQPTVFTTHKPWRY